MSAIIRDKCRDDKYMMFHVIFFYSVHIMYANIQSYTLISTKYTCIEEMYTSMA